MTFNFYYVYFIHIYIYILKVFLFKIKLVSFPLLGNYRRSSRTFGPRLFYGIYSSIQFGSVEDKSTTYIHMYTHDIYRAMGGAKSSN